MLSKQDIIFALGPICCILEHFWCLRFYKSKIKFLFLPAPCLGHMM